MHFVNCFIMVLFKKYKILKRNDKNYRQIGQKVFYFLPKLSVKSDFAANSAADFSARRLNDRAGAD